MTLLELCRKYFGTDNLYDVLNTNKNATDKEVRKAYYVLSMKCHPDKVKEEDKVEATEKFKVISLIHALLSDTNKRKLYDNTGSVGDVDLKSTTKWQEYWRSIFRTITDDDIKEYESKYKGSDDEKRDLKKGYIAGKGDMEFIVNMVPFSTVYEEDRLREILEKIIEEEDLPRYKAFTNEPPAKKRKRLLKAKREEAEFNIEMEKEKKNDSNDLLLAIQKRSAERANQNDNFLAGLEAKYCKPKTSKKSKKTT